MSQKLKILPPQPKKEALPEGEKKPRKQKKEKPKEDVVSWEVSDHGKKKQTTNILFDLLF